MVGYTWMAKYKQLTPLPFKRLTSLTVVAHHVCCHPCLTTSMLHFEYYWPFILWFIEASLESTFWFKCQPHSCPPPLLDNIASVSSDSIGAIEMLYYYYYYYYYLSYGDCLEVKREYYQNCSVLDCVTQCSQSAAHLCEQFLQVQQIGFVTLGPLHCARRLPRVVLL